MNNNLEAWTEGGKMEENLGLNFQDIEDYDVTDSSSTFYDYQTFTVIKWNIVSKDLICNLYFNLNFVENLKYLFLNSLLSVFLAKDLVNSWFCQTIEKESKASEGSR